MSVLGVTSRFELFDTDNPCHVTIERVLTGIVTSGTTVHGTGLYNHTPVEGVDYDALLALVADSAALVPLLDELVRDRTMSCRGITVADGYRDFPAYLHSFLVEGATLVRHYNVPGSLLPHRARLIAIAFLPDGPILTVNEPHGRHWINLYDGVRDTK